MSAPSGRADEGAELHRNGDTSGLGRRANPRRRSSWEAPAAGGDARHAQHGRPEQRVEAPRVRPGVPVTTGQVPVARTRSVEPGPTGTAPIPVLRTAPPAPRTPSVASDRRLRSLTEPNTGPAAEPIAPAPAAPTGRPMLQATQARSRRPDPLPPKPTEFAPAPVRERPRRPVRVLAAILAVIGLGLVNALPAFTGESLAAPPVLGVRDDDVQHLSVGSDVSTAGASLDAVSGAIAAPGWQRPVDGRIGDPFGPRPDQPVAGVSLFHRGQDLVAPCGAPVRAAAAGTVVSAGWWGTYGNWILVDHGGGVATGYAHEEQLLVSVGQRVREGQVIGLVGQTGAATGCHLHLEVHLNGVAVNPVPFFAAKRAPLG